MGRGLVIPWPVYPKAEMWVASLLEVSSWSIRDNYDSLGHRLPVNSILYFTKISSLFCCSYECVSLQTYRCHKLVT